MDDIDDHCSVIEPEHPTRADIARRVVVGSWKLYCINMMMQANKIKPLCYPAQFVSLQIKLSPVDPRGIPECEFFGAPSAISPLRQLLNANLAKWSDEMTTRENLQAILELQFPSRSRTADDVDELRQNCQICYSYRLADSGETPDRVCDSTRCGQPFHSYPCLLEWLQSNVNKRVSFDSVTGECPYCSSPITIKLLKR